MAKKGKKLICTTAELVLLAIFAILLLTCIILACVVVLITPDKNPFYHAYPVVITSGQAKSQYVRRFEKCVCTGGRGYLEGPDKPRPKKVSRRHRRQRRQIPFEPEYLVYESEDNVQEPQAEEDFLNVFLASNDTQTRVQRQQNDVHHRAMQQLSRCTLQPDRRQINRMRIHPQETAVQIKRFPFLVSLSDLSYHESQQERRFACNGVVLSRDWIMSAEECVQAEDEWPSILVRAGSDHWAVGGTEHTVVQVVHLEDAFKGPVGLRIFPPLTMSDAVQPLKIHVPQPNTRWTEAVSPGWTRVLSANLGERRKYDKFTVETWTRSFCERCPVGSFDGTTECDDSNLGRPLVARNALVGMQTGAGCKKLPRFSRRTTPKERFERLEVEEIKEWTNSMLDNRLVNATVYNPPQNPSSAMLAKKIGETIYKTDDNAQGITFQYEPEVTLSSFVPDDKSTEAQALNTLETNVATPIEN